MPFAKAGWPCAGGSPNAGSGGFERYMDGTKEGTFYPYDQDPLSGWCGHGDDGGDRVTWIVFDLNDFSHDAIARALLRCLLPILPCSLPSSLAPHHPP